MANQSPLRPTRPDPATGLTRPGQTQSENPASAYQAPADGVQAPQPRLGGGIYVTGFGEPGGPMQSAYSAPSVPTGPLSPPTLPRGAVDTAMTGRLMPSGNSPMSIQPRGQDSAAATQQDLLGSVVDLVRRNGGNPFDPR